MSAIDGFLTPAEVADELDVSHSQVTRYVKDGLLEASRIGRQILIPASQLKDFERPLRGNPAFRKKDCE